MKRLHHFLFFIVLLAGCASIASAQKQMTEDDRRVWAEKMRDLKHKHLVKELNLSRDQQNEFFPIYDAMEDELIALNQQARDMEMKLENSPLTSDLEYTSAARTMFEQKDKEYKIEMAYFAKFEKVLSPKQLFKLKAAERAFMGKVVRKHGRMRNDAAKSAADCSKGRR